MCKGRDNNDKRVVIASSYPVYNFYVFICVTNNPVA